MRRYSQLLLTILIAISVTGCATNDLKECAIASTSEGCYFNIGGQQFLMTCPKHIPALMSQEQIDNSMGLFINFLESPKSAIAIERSIKREKEGVLIDTHKLFNEGDEIDMMAGRRYIASMSFRSIGSGVADTKGIYYSFRGRATDLDDKWKHIILTNLIGQGYNRFSPTLRNLRDESISVDVLFSDAHELKMLLNKRGLTSLRHIGNRIYPLEEIAI